VTDSIRTAGISMAVPLPNPATCRNALGLMHDPSRLLRVEESRGAFGWKSSQMAGAWRTRLVLD